MSSQENSGASRTDHLRVVSHDDAREGARPPVPDTSTRPPSEFLTRFRELEARNAPKADRLRLVFVHCHGMVYAVASRITGSPWDAEDVTQSVFEELSRQLHDIRHPKAIPSFLKTIAVRVSLRRVKRERWRRRRLEIAFAGAHEPLEAPPDAAVTVRQLLAQLEPEERAAVVLRYVEMHSHDEVAGLMGVSSATARRRLASGRTKLVRLLGEQRVDEMFGTGGET